MQSVRRAVRCEGSNGIEGMRCGSKVGLWHFDFGPWPWTHAPVSAAAWRRRIIQGGWVLCTAGQREIPCPFAHGYRRWWRDLPRCEWAQLLHIMYLGTSGRRGIEYFCPPKIRSMTRTDWDKRQRYTEPWCFGSMEEGAGEDNRESREGRRSVVRRTYPDPTPCVLCPASCGLHL